MGPQHPSTHGVLRLMMELDGETVLRTKPIIGYLHTGMEKTGEELTYQQGATNVTRMDYLSPLNNELVFSLATETLLGIELPPRAVWIRMLLSELQRMSSHLMWMATNGMDVGSTTMMIFGFREREMLLGFFEKTTGLRMNHNFIRPGGIAADLPDGWEDDVDLICENVTLRLDDYDELLTGQPIFRERMEGVGALSADEALALSATGPILRSTGVAWDLRRTMPYLAYDEVDFDVIIGTYGDNFDRYAIRLNEIRESIRIIRQVLEQDAAPATTGCRTRRSPRRRGPASTSRWRPSSTTSSCSPRASRSPRARSTWRSSRPAASSAATSCPTGRPSRTGCTSGRPSFVNLQSLPGDAARRAHRRRRGHHLVGRPGHGGGGPVTSTRPGTCPTRSSPGRGSSSPCTRTRARR